jgi:putative ABC transport system permease protein
VLGRVLILTSSGAVAGLALGLIAARALQGILFDTGPTDAVAISSAVTLLTVTGAVACYFPVRRALRVDPASALRAE